MQVQSQSLSTKAAYANPELDSVSNTRDSFQYLWSSSVLIFLQDFAKIRIFDVERCTPLLNPTGSATVKGLSRVLETITVPEFSSLMALITQPWSCLTQDQGWNSKIRLKRVDKMNKFMYDHCQTLRRTTCCHEAICSFPNSFGGIRRESHCAIMVYRILLANLENGGPHAAGGKCFSYGKKCFPFHV